MNIKESLDIFGLSNISEESEENLKKIYKKLMIKYHPDNYDGNDSKAKDISMAYKVIKDTLKKIDTFEKLNGTHKVVQSTVVISLDNLIQLYKNKEIIFKNKLDSSKKRVFTTANLQNNGALLIIDWSVSVNGVPNTFSNICHWNSNDNYQVSCDVIVENLSDECNMKIKILDRDKEYNIKSQSVKLKISFDYNINVEILISKKLKPDENIQA